MDPPVHVSVMIPAAEEAMAVVEKGVIMIAVVTLGDAVEFVPPRTVPVIVTVVVICVVDERVRVVVLVPLFDVVFTEVIVADPLESE